MRQTDLEAYCVMIDQLLKCLKLMNGDSVIFKSFKSLSKVLVINYFVSF